MQALHLNSEIWAQLLALTGSLLASTWLDSSVVIQRLDNVLAILDIFAWIWQVLSLTVTVSPARRGEGFYIKAEPLLHLGMPFGELLLPEVCLNPPLPPNPAFLQGWGFCVTLSGRTWAGSFDWTCRKWLGVGEGRGTQGTSFAPLLLLPQRALSSNVQTTRSPAGTVLTSTILVPSNLIDAKFSPAFCLAT